MGRPCFKLERDHPMPLAGVDEAGCAPLAGPVVAPAAYFCKHPPRQMTDDEAYEAVETFIADGARAPAPAS